MCVCIYLHICTPSLHVYVYIFTYMVTEFPGVGVHSYIYAHGVYMCLCTYLHICTRRLHVCGYIFTCIHQVYWYVYTPCLNVYVCIYWATNAEFICVCVHIYIPPDPINHVCSLTGKYISKINFTYCPVQIYKIMFRRFLFSRI